MKLEELNESLDQLKKNYESDRKRLIIKYCNENGKYKVGDIFTDHIGSILIEKIKYHVDERDQLYCQVYDGKILNKDGTVSKVKKNTRQAYQCNEKVKES